MNLDREIENDEDEHMLPASESQESALWYVVPSDVEKRLRNDWRESLDPRIFSEFKTERSPEDVFEEAAAKVKNKIEINRKILGGAPCIAGTRIPVYAILQLIEAGYTAKKVLKAFPSITQEDLNAALRFAVIVMER